MLVSIFQQNIVGLAAVGFCLRSIMEKDASEQQNNDDTAVVDQPKLKPGATAPFRYTKEELLDIKELPISNKRPDCLCEKYDSFIPNFTCILLHSFYYQK
ncbi:hypothetical protein ILYODFUR_037145 [Ilyodon furcidens]|uniref:Uncharacterized protein n=1 Tax=Ilyodon furcidens TaxID=33524 RepID=A0ABV0UQ32_9TELE